MRIHGLHSLVQYIQFSSWLDPFLNFLIESSSMLKESILLIIFFRNLSFRLCQDRPGTVLRVSIN